MRRALALCALWGVLGRFAGAQDNSFTTHVTTIEPPFELAGERLLDVDGDGHTELLVFARDGRVRTWRPLSGANATNALGELALEDPGHTLVDIARYGERSYLIAATPKGVVGYPASDDRSFASTPATLIARGKFTLRVGEPTQSGIVQDVNRDGVPDIVLPGPNGCELWLAHPQENGAANASLPTFQRAATIAVEVGRGGDFESEKLSDHLEASFTIPNIDTRDVNGDGHPDLLVEDGPRRAFHLQRADGSFPVQADITVDTSVFKDTTESSGFEFGGTISGGDDATYRARDVDGDKIPDYVIAHRRKVWVFRASSAGPQFTEPSAILKAAEDVTAVLVINLDDDKLPELLLVKVQIPTLATLLRGLFGEWDVPIGVVGYKNLGGGKFDTTPRWKNELTVRLPGIIGMVKNPSKLLERFDDLGKRFRTAERGELDGAGTSDVAIVSEDQKSLDIWFGRPGEGESDETGERQLRTILFEETDSVWNVDRVLIALGDLAQRQIAMQTGGRAADLVVALRDPKIDKLSSLDIADFDGDGRGEVVLTYERRSGVRRSSFDVVQLEKKTQ